MKFRFLFTLAFLWASFNAVSQHLASSWTYVAFEDNSPVRSEPSMKAKVLGSLKHNESFTPYHNSRAVSDTINDRIGYWRAVEWEDTIGFVWGGLLAKGALNSKVYQEQRFLLHFHSSNKLAVKVFKKERFASTFFFEVDSHDYLQGSISLGATWNSGGNEVIGIVFQNGGHELLEWNGKTLKLSDIALSDESQVSGKYLPLGGAIINTSGVNIRALPGDTSPALGSLPKYSRLPMVKEYHTYDKKYRRYWHAVKWQDTLGFILADYLDVPYKSIGNNRNGKEQFLATSNALYVLKEGKIISRAQGWFQGDDHLINFGSRGFGEEMQFIARCYSANSCGQAGGDAYYAWNGREIKYFGEDYTVGDGGYSDGDQLIFPDQGNAGMAGHVIRHQWQAEATSESFNVSDRHKDDMLFSNFFVMKYEDDTLKEVESRHSKLRDLIKRKFPERTLMHYRFFDINDDGNEDALFFVADRKYYEHHWERKRSAIGFVLGTPKGDFKDLVYNEKLVGSDYNLVSFELDENEISIAIRYQVCWYSGNAEEARRTELVYTFDQKEKKLVWQSRIDVENIEKDDEHSILWGNERKQVFKTNTIYFEDSW